MRKNTWACFDKIGRLKALFLLLETGVVMVNISIVMELKKLKKMIEPTIEQSHVSKLSMYAGAIST